MANIDPFYITLYAIRRRQGVADNGYPKQVPFYSPPKLGDVMSEPKEIISDEDWAIAEAIEQCVNEIRLRRPVLAQCFDIWEGAYEGAPPSRSERCKDWNVKYGACKKNAQRCKKELERKMYG